MNPFKSPLKITYLSTSIVICLLSNINSSFAESTGHTGGSGNPLDVNGGITCNGATCHSGGLSPMAIIEGPKTVVLDSLNLYKLTMSGGQNLIGGMNISSDTGTLSVLTNDANVKLLNGELTHTSPKGLNVSDDTTISWFFEWQAPAVGATATLYGSALSGNNNSSPSGDGFSNAGPEIITLVANAAALTPQSVKAYIDAPFVAWVGNLFTLNAKESFATDGFIKEYIWEYQSTDATTSTTTTITKSQTSGVFQKSFPGTGNKVVKLTVVSDKGIKNNTFFDIKIVAKTDALEPNAKITAPVTAAINQTVTFDASLSQPDPSLIQSYIWDFGDGKGKVNSELVVNAPVTTASHTYTTEGQYKVTLAVVSKADVSAVSLTGIDTFDIKIGPATGGGGGGNGAVTAKALYESNCTGASCHGIEGIANGVIAKNIQGSTTGIITNSITSVPQMINLNIMLNVAEKQQIADYLGSGTIAVPLLETGISQYTVKCQLCHGVNAVGVANLGKAKAGAKAPKILNAINPASAKPIPLMQGIKLSSVQATAIETYLGTVPQVASALAGKALYIANCQNCHGTGSGGHAIGVLNATAAVIKLKIQNIPDMQGLSNTLVTGNVEDISAFLNTTVVTPLAPLAQPLTGKGLFDMYCSYCHGLDGRGKVAEKKLKTGLKGQDIMDAYSKGANNKTMFNTNLPMVGFTSTKNTGQLDLMANYIDILMGGGS